MDAAIVASGMVRDKLTETDVREIRRLVAAGHKHRVLATRFGVSQPTISNVTTGVSWAWLP